MLKELQAIRKSVLEIDNLAPVVGFNTVRPFSAKLVEDPHWRMHEHDAFAIRVLFPWKHDGEIDFSRIEDIHITLPHNAHQGVATEDIGRIYSLLISQTELSVARGGSPHAQFSLSALPSRCVSATEFTFPRDALTSFFADEKRDLEHLRLIVAMLFSILSRLSETSGAREASPADAIAAYIRANYSRQNLSVSEIAEKNGFSPNYIQKVFRAKWNCTLIDYINQVRLNSARLLLRQHQWQVKEVAEMCGFSYVHYFCKRYRQYFGNPPSAE